MGWVLVRVWHPWQRWAAEHQRQPLPATAGDVAACLQAPATIRVACAAIAKMHQVSGLRDPTTDSLCRDVAAGSDAKAATRGRGQVAGVGWVPAEVTTLCRGCATERSSG